jgi:hypothetical protein
MEQTILLVRHGRSAHVHRGFIDVAGFHQWRAAYEAAGIDEQDRPPAALKDLARESGITVASTAPRAMRSAMLLAQNITTSPLLEELELLPLNIRGIRMPLLGWALSIGFRSMVQGVSLALRSLLSRELVERRWQCEIPKGRSRHWSVWSFERRSRDE